MFRSARLKLTFFYLAVLVVFSLFLTISVRILAQHEFDNSNVAQRGEVHRLLLQLFSIPPRSDSGFITTQQSQQQQVHRRLDQDVILVNIAAIIIGGVLSYWYAGRALRPIEDAHELQKRFAADASHELRTPLTNLKLENEVFLRQKTFTSSDARQLIGSNLEEVQRLESLATNLLSLTQYEQATLPLESLQVNKLVDEALQQVNKVAESKQVTFKQEVATALVRGQSDSLVQLLIIVLENAIKYGPAKGTVFIKGIKHDGHYVLTIRDQGPGISEVDLPHIFERLYRGDKARTGGSGGYGLGLALAKEIARANHATITAISSNVIEQGAIFNLTLNVAKTPKHPPQPLT